MKDLTIEEQKVRDEYKVASVEERALLERLFGKSLFELPITERVKTMEDVYRIKGVTPESILPFPKPENSFQEALNGVAECFLITEVLNEGWVPNWEDENEYKWHIWFKQGAGFGFSSTYYAYWFAFSFVGSRLCFKSREIAEYAAKTFPKCYQKFHSL